MPRRPVPVGETRAQKFERLANLRTTQILDGLRKLGSLSNRNHYDYSEDEVQRIFAIIEEAVGTPKAVFSANQTQLPLIILSESGKDYVTVLWQNVHMPDEHSLALRQASDLRSDISRSVADQARTDLAALESDLQFIMSQLARIPTRAFLCSMLLLATARIWALLAVVLLVRLP